MALTLRANGSGTPNLIGANWFNDFYNLLTGVMTDQPVTLDYLPASSTTTPVLLLKGNANGPLLLGFNGATQEFYVDQSGNVGAQGYLLLGAAESGSQSQLFYSHANLAAQLNSPQAGAGATGIAFGTWTGSVAKVPFSIGGQFNGALAWVDNSGNCNCPSVFSTNGSLNLFSQQSGAASGLIVKAWSGTAQVVPFSVGGQYGSALAWVDNSGNVTANSFVGVAAGCTIPMTRNGSIVADPIYTGTSTPTGNGTTTPATGAVWIKG